MKVRNSALLIALFVLAAAPITASAGNPAAHLSAGSVTFGESNPVGPYPAQVVSVSNTGDATLVISNISIDNAPGASDYSQSNSCYPFPRSLVPGESCSINVGFFPDSFGVRQGSLSISDNAAGSPQRVALTGFAYPFRAMYTLDAYGGLHPASATSPPMPGGGYWLGWKIARAAALLSDASGGYTLDGYGGLHPFGAAPAPAGAAYFGWDIARDVVVMPGSSSRSAGGYVLDGYGGLHPFGGAPAVHGGGYWPGWDIARKVKLLPDGTGGYVMDSWGGLHPFAVATNPLPRTITDAAYWPNWKIARDFDLFSNSTGTTAAGFTLDGFGGVHPFGFAPSGPTFAGGYWGGWDIARTVRINPSSTTASPFGWVMEGFGGFHAFNGGQDTPQAAYWNADLAVELVVVR